jgi:predicted transglutaminase-like cysteine proteinase
MTETLTSADYQILNQTRRDFTYVADATQWDRREHWKIHRETGAFSDDCDGFALTLAYRLCGSDDDRMLGAFRDGTAAIVRVRTPYSTDGSTHAVLRWKGFYVDNITPTFRPLEELGAGWSYVKTFSWRTVAAKVLLSNKSNQRGLLFGVIGLAVVGVVIVKSLF